MVPKHTCAFTCAMNCKFSWRTPLKEGCYTYVCNCAINRKHLGLCFNWSLFLEVIISRPFELQIHTENKNGVTQTLQWKYDMSLPMIKETKVQNVVKEPRPNDVEMVEVIEEIRKLPTRNKITCFSQPCANTFRDNFVQKLYKERCDPLSSG